MTEEWRAVPGYGGNFEASSLGRVRSKTRIVKKRHRTGKIMEQVYQQKILTPYVDRDGYRKVHIGWGGKRASVGVHALVCAAWFGEKPKGLVCCHADGDPANNLPGNLRWDTQASNNADRLRHGTYKRGTEHPMSKHPTELVRSIVYGEIGRKEALDAGVSATQFYRLKGRSAAWFERTYGETA